MRNGDIKTVLDWLDQALRRELSDFSALNKPREKPDCWGCLVLTMATKPQKCGPMIQSEKKFFEFRRKMDSCLLALLFTIVKSTLKEE